MLINFGKYAILSPWTKTFPIMPLSKGRSCVLIDPISPSRRPMSCFQRRGLRTLCNAIRRRVRYDDSDSDGDQDYGHNEEIAMLESYSQSARGELLLVKALVDDQQVEVLVYKGFSSSLSYETYPDPSRSILPARAVIKSIDRVKGPFDPSNIQYLQKGLTWQEFKTNFLSN